MNTIEDRGKIITNLVPKSEIYLGLQPDLIKLPNETQEFKRFLKTLIEFFSIISIDKLLCLFFDDLQWSDTSSIQLIKELLNQTNRKILILTSFRDNEITLNHPMTTILKPIIEKSKFETIHLGNLNSNHILEILKDSLKLRDIDDDEEETTGGGCDNDENVFIKNESFRNEKKKELIKLSELIFKKTNRNPFFIKEFLFNLHDKNFLKFDYSKECWIWEIEKIKSTKFSENVVKFMIEKLNSFSIEMKKLLNFESCIGNEFTLDLLFQICEMKSKQETYKIVVESIKLGWIIEFRNKFMFIHDRLQQASYEIFENKKPIHLKIGKLFLKNSLKNNEIEKFIFDIVNNLNLSGDLYEDKENLKTNEASLKTSAFEAALEYTKNSKLILGLNSWESNHDLTFEVNLYHAKNLALTNKIEDACLIYEELLVNSKTNFKKLKIGGPYVKILSVIPNIKRSIEVAMLVFASYDLTKEWTTIPDNQLNEWNKNLLDEILEYFKDKPTPQDFLNSIPKEMTEEMKLFSSFFTEGNILFFNSAQHQRSLSINLLGINKAYGNVMLGTLGFEKRLDATVISKTVNTASRMESLTKTLGVDIIITEEIFNEIECQYLGSFYLKGQENSKKLYQVLNQKLSKNDLKNFEIELKLFSEKI